MSASNWALHSGHLKFGVSRRSRQSPRFKMCVSKCGFGYQSERFGLCVSKWAYQYITVGVSNWTFQMGRFKVSFSTRALQRGRFKVGVSESAFQSRRFKVRAFPIGVLKWERQVGVSIWAIQSGRFKVAVSTFQN